MSAAPRGCMHHGSGLSPALLLCPAVELFLLLLGCGPSFREPKPSEQGLPECGRPVRTPAIPRQRLRARTQPEWPRSHDCGPHPALRNEQGSVREKRNRKKDRKAETSRPVGATVSDSGTSSRITVNLVTPWERRETGWQRQRRPRRLR